MQIRQAVGSTRTRREDTLRFLRGFLEELKADGFIAASLRRSGRNDAAVAPPCPGWRPSEPGPSSRTREMTVGETRGGQPGRRVRGSIPGGHKGSLSP